MREERMTADRVATFSDAVFAVIMTIMVLDLRAPDGLAFSDLWPLWPTAISYAVSYLFVAIIWTRPMSRPPWTRGSRGPCWRGPSRGRGAAYAGAP
jgi:Endosomal/lysosomal potassium channel TMEM175